MKFFFTLALMALSLLSNAQVALKAISYNIKYHDQKAEVDTWDERKDAMIVFFRDEIADFFGLQEVLESQLKFIDQELEHYNYIGVGRDDGENEGEFCPILYDSTVWRPIKHKTIWLSETPNEVSIGWDAACNRIVTFGIFENRESGDQIAIFNTHFDHKGKEAKRKSVELLVDFVKKESLGLPTLILGDFNLEPNGSLYWALTDDFHDTKFKSYSVHEEHEGTYNGFQLEGRFRDRIDYIFFQGGIEAISYECPDLRIDGRHVSDHFPVIAVLQLTPDD
ncbi:endonuclease/exonuclease/phosphatase family protein [Portibacter marinus]|uniref:endonuclease/exonuclease/phosphatase family protein n=1 Tax=Portibacter marinus TaxID=2898660 RepID=UPI001F1EEBEC|nr:endonuclease/exonuclease/phosphatase family protein [Portibacter marinus]